MSRTAWTTDWSAVVPCQPPRCSGRSHASRRFLIASNTRSPAPVPTVSYKDLIAFGSGYPHRTKDSAGSDQVSLSSEHRQTGSQSESMT